MSVAFRAQLVAGGRYMANFPQSLRRVSAERFGLKQLPIGIKQPPWSLVLITLKNRIPKHVAGQTATKLKPDYRGQRRSESVNKEIPEKTRRRAAFQAAGNLTPVRTANR